MSKFAEVRKAQKSTHYTITPIGGAADLARWKSDQIVKDAEWQKAQEPARAERRANAQAVVRGDVKPALSATDKAEIAYRQSRTTPPKTLPPPPLRSYEEIMGVELKVSKKSLYGHFKDTFAAIWRNAFRTERE